MYGSGVRETLLYAADQAILLVWSATGYTEHIGGFVGDEQEFILIHDFNTGIEGG